jgi:hypothetical protein
MCRKLVMAVATIGAASGAWASPPSAESLALGLSVTGLDIAPGSMQVASLNTYDYTFTSAPYDWVSRGGGWGSFPRWVCDPRWSWYGGASSRVAATWNKRRFSGDLAVTVYAAFSDWDPEGYGRPHFKNPNDLNLTLYGDGANLDSGYSFMLGADLNSRTCIIRAGRVLAERTDREALLPRFEEDWAARRTAHKRWWSVRAERVGHRLRLFMDNKLVLEATDDDPLIDGSVAIWTLDNGLVISRVRLDYERELLGTSLAGASRSRPGGPVAHASENDPDHRLHR